MTAENNDAFEEGATQMSDALLVSTAKSGDADAFVELSKRHYRMVFHQTIESPEIGRMRKMRFRTPY